MEDAKHLIDGISIVAVISTLAGWLPSVAAILSIAWTCLRIYETKTVQRWLGK